MTRVREKSGLDDTSWDRLQEVLERFEGDCAKSYPRDLAQYLVGLTEPTRGVVLEELVRTDLEIGWRRRQGILVEHYESRFPELVERSCRLDLLRDEFRLRHNFGDRPTLAEYQSRFPAEYEAFARVVEELIASEGTGDSGLESDVETLPAAKPKSFSGDESLETSFAISGSFKKVRKIGSGGFGEVWEALAPGGVPVAIKRIHGTVTAKSVEREKKSLDLICSGKLRHPFLLQVFSWWIQDERLQIVMELADNSLDDRLKELKKAGQTGLPKEELRQVMIDAASALDFLNHERNILHRDVKPANMLLMGNRLKLCDFGLSRMSEKLSLDSGKTRGAGTPIFIAPEIIAGHQSVHSDQYSLAASYYMLRAGRPVFRGRAKEIRRQHVEQAPLFDDQILSSAEKRVLMKALSKAPEDRYPTSTAFVHDLLEAMDQVDATAPADPLPPTAVGEPSDHSAAGRGVEPTAPTMPTTPESPPPEETAAYVSSSASLTPAASGSTPRPALEPTPVRPADPRAPDPAPSPGAPAAPKKRNWQHLSRAGTGSRLSQRVPNPAGAGNKPTKRELVAPAPLAADPVLDPSPKVPPTGVKKEGLVPLLVLALIICILLLVAGLLLWGR